MYGSEHSTMSRFAQTRLMFSTSICIVGSFGVTSLLLFHFYIILTGQSTIDWFLNRIFFNSRNIQNNYDEQEIYKINNKGYIENWKWTFQEYGYFWWIKWIFPKFFKSEQLIKIMLQGKKPKKKV